VDGAVNKRFGAVVLALGMLMASIGPAYARPRPPDDCAFDPAFVAFREAVGEEIVGDCEAGPSTDKHGVISQETSEGTLVLDARTHRVGFRSYSQYWADGPRGLGADITVDGLSDRGIEREAVVAPAARVFELAALDPDELGPDWTYATVSGGTMMSGVQLGCAPDAESDDGMAGYVQTWLWDEEHERGVAHLLQALPDWHGEAMRPEMERFATACDGWTGQARRGALILHVQLEPYVSLGDESLLMRMVVEERASGQQIGYHIGYVRYGGLISMLAVRKGPDDADDDLRAALEWLAQRAHSRVEGAAWYLRP
jgi:hypothetical protein